MALLEINKGRAITLPASVRKKYSLKPGSKLEIRDKGGSIELTPLGKGGDIFGYIDKHTSPVSDKEITKLIKRGRLHALLHRR